MDIPREDLVDMYETMVKIRRFEERIREIYLADKLPAFDIAAGLVPGEMHLAAGQEPVAVGMRPHLKAGDAITATHRPHHVAIAQGVDLKKMAAEIFGRDTGLGHGKGGHMHLYSVEPNFGCSGIIGEGIPVAVGAAMAFRHKGTDNVALSFFGEGAANQGWAGRKSSSTRLRRSATRNVARPSARMRGSRMNSAAGRSGSEATPR